MARQPASKRATEKKASFAAAFCVWILCAAPGSVHACAVCFGQGDNPDLPRAFSWGVFLLLAATFGVLGTFVAGVHRIESRKKAADAD